MQMLSKSGQPVKKKASSVETTNENPSDKMQVLGRSFPAMPMQQLTDNDHFDAFGDVLCSKIDVEPSINGAASDSSDWYNPVLNLSGEIPLNQPSKRLVVEAEGYQVAMKYPRCKSTLKKRRVWSTEEHRQFLHGAQCLGRGEWKAISMYYVPSRTPAQLASHAQKYFKRIEKNYLYEKRQMYSMNDAKLVNHGRYNPEVSGAEPEKVKPTESCIPQPKNVNFLDDQTFLDDLAQRMPTFGQTSNSATNVARQMPFNNGTLGSLQWEASGTCPTKEQGSVLLYQTGGISAEARTSPFYRQSFGTGNQIPMDNTVLPSVFTARTPRQAPHYGKEATTQPTFQRHHHSEAGDGSPVVAC